MMKKIGVDMDDNDMVLRAFDKPFIKFKDSEKIGNILSKDVGGMSLVAMWVRTDSFEFIKDKNKIN
tara:strand:- start:658 stop:855 length:198 start_codon:yes stop_codon:yes gene_type:complete